MEKELENIKFKYSFRDYQQEALEMLEKYIHDKKIHIVAAPGAGKTILALELMLRIGNKTLILAPTIAIKEQWIERLKKDFINGDKENLISSDLETPSVITVITYQYLYSLNRKKVNLEKIIKDNNIKTIILDEAHHLRNVWQKTLKELTDKLKEVTTISLTATPPYDDGSSFSNYMDLCGEIDAKITIPQLVKSSCLCPHQDYIYLNVPTETQEKEMLKFNIDVKNFIDKLKKNKEFIKCLALNEYIINTEENTNDILKEFNFYISMLSFLKEVKCPIPNNKINKDIKIPLFNKEFMQIILERYIFGKTIKEKEIFKELFDEIKKELRNLECIDEDNKINLKYNKKISDMLIKNAGKLDSISKIIDIEKQSLKEKLKLVVITDYIKEEYYQVESEEELNEIGVMPIFRKVIANNENISIAVLTGTLVIIPTHLKQDLYDIAKKEYHIEKDSIRVTELGIDFNYSKVDLESRYDRYLVNLITKLFNQTDISVLIGTVALIGEGWDAPFVNSLVMATIVSSYVTSNQVRGRTIRINKLDNQKVSNIWHLVCVEKEKDGYILGHDYEILAKRFLAFEGINIDEDTIDTGVDRLNLKNFKYGKEQIEQINNKMISKSVNRKWVNTTWKKALESYVPICTEKIPEEFIYRNKTDKIARKVEGTFYNFLQIAKCAFFPMIFYYLAKTAVTIDMQKIWIMSMLSSIFIIVAVIGNKKTLNFSCSYEMFIKKICKAVYKSMKKTGQLESKTKYFVRLSKKNIIYGLKNASTYEQMIYLKAIKQAIKLDENSRYIIKCGNNTCSVPEMFAKNKKEATLFFSNFTSLGKRLIYTKTEVGKKVLLERKLKEFRKQI